MLAMAVVVAVVFTFIIGPVLFKYLPNRSSIQYTVYNHDGRKAANLTYPDDSVNKPSSSRSRWWCCKGMLPVAYGMAAVGGTGLAVAPALLASFGIISAYTMISVGRACQRTKRWSFSGLWTDLVGKKSAWVSGVGIQ